MWWCDLSTFWKRTPSTLCCRMARHQQLPTPFLFRSEKHRRKPELQAFAGRCGGAISRPSGSERLQHFVAGWRVISSYPRLSFSDLKSIGVSQNCKLLPADVVVRSLDLLEANAFNTLLQDGASSAVTHAFPFPI